MTGLLGCRQILSNSEVGFLGNLKGRLSKLSLSLIKIEVEQEIKLDVNNNQVAPSAEECELDLTTVLQELALSTAGCRNGILEPDLNNNELVIDEEAAEVAVVSDPYQHINFQPW